MVRIVELNEQGTMYTKAVYSLKNTKEALICYLEQFLNNNPNK